MKRGNRSSCNCLSNVWPGAGAERCTGRQGGREERVGERVGYARGSGGVQYRGRGSV